jgi:c-di-GMP-binding flagellar brake protein YcgR
MNVDFAERRRHIRVYFDSVEETSCRFTPEKKAVGVLSASVLDVSLGGIHLMVTESVSFIVGDQLILNSLTHRTGLVCGEEIPMVIRWVFTQATSRHLYLGCQFLFLPEQSRCHIANLISVKLLETSTARTGLYSQ